jgi:hypothetical protein
MIVKFFLRALQKRHLALAANERKSPGQLALIKPSHSPVVDPGWPCCSMSHYRNSPEAAQRRRQCCAESGTENRDGKSLG